MFGFRLLVFLRFAKTRPKTCRLDAGRLDRARGLHAGGLDAVARVLGLCIGVRGLDQRWAHCTPQGEVEIGEHDVAVVAEEDVLRLEVAVDDPLRADEKKIYLNYIHILTLSRRYMSYFLFQSKIYGNLFLLFLYHLWIPQFTSQFQLLPPFRHKLFGTEF